MMRKTVLITAISGLSLSLALPVNAAQGATLDQRVNRLERMMENPVLLQLSRRLGEQQRDIQSLQDENDRLKRDLRSLRALMDKRYKESDDRLSTLEGGKPKASALAPVEDKAEFDVVSNANTVQSDAKVDGQTELTNTRVEESVLPSVRAETIKVDADKNASKPESEEVSSTTEVVPNEVAKIETRPATDVEKEKYKNAFALMRASKYDASIKDFQEFISLYPESELASNAAYWSGEGYLIKGQNQKALDAFLTVIKRYPESSKVPDATLRAGDSYENLGNKEQAIKFYKEIIESRPHSRAAKNAQKRLEKL